MRTQTAPQARAGALKRELPPPAVSDNPGFTPRGSVERPPSLREFIIRWLNEEL